MIGHKDLCEDAKKNLKSFRTDVIKLQTDNFKEINFLMVLLKKVSIY